MNLTALTNLAATSMTLTGRLDLLVRTDIDPVTLQTIPVYETVWTGPCTVWTDPDPTIEVHGTVSTTSVTKLTAVIPGGVPVRIGHVLTITTAPTNPSLTGQQFRITDVPVNPMLIAQACRAEKTGA